MSVLLHEDISVDNISLVSNLRHDREDILALERLVHLIDGFLTRFHGCRDHLLYLGALPCQLQQLIHELSQGRGELGDFLVLVLSEALFDQIQRSYLACVLLQHTWLLVSS